MTKKIAYYLKVIIVETKAEFIAHAIYISASLFHLISQILLLIMQYYLWKAIALSNPDYSLDYLISYSIVSLLINNLYPKSISREIEFSIKKGNFKNFLLVPLAYEVQIFGHALGRSLYILVSQSLPLSFLGIAVFGFNRSISPGKLLYLFLFLALSYLLLFAIELTIGLLTILTNSIWGINSLKIALISLLSGQLIPFELYPNSFATFIEKLPFANLFSTPIRLILGADYVVNENLAILFITCCVMFFIYFLVKKRALSLFSTNGG